MDAIKYYVKGAFQGVEQTPAAVEQQEELIADLEAKVADLVEQGDTQEQALGVAIASMGDLTPLVSEFVAEQPTAPLPAVLAPAPIPTAEVYTTRLRLHAVALSAIIGLGGLFLFSLLLLTSDSLNAEAALFALLAAIAAFVWVGWELRRFHADRGETRETIELDFRPRFVTALKWWAGASVTALVFNVAAGARFWAWVVWGATAAWPLAVKVEERLIERGMFVVQPAEEPAAGECRAAEKVATA